MDLVGSPVVKPLPIKSLNAYLSKVVMCTEASDILKFRIDYIYQIRIIFLVKLLKKWSRGRREGAKWREKLVSFMDEPLNKDSGIDSHT